MLAGRRTGVTVAAPAENIEHSDEKKLLDQLRATLVRLRQAGIAPDDLLHTVQMKVQAMKSASKENPNE